ncbi:MAG: hypothetical protein JXR40_05700 [Pontiellaceae bacterium]|nr:hypothetical protein [Pontiellaceae bacterium]
MKKEGIKLALAVSLIAGLSGCAMFNRGELQYTRTTTIGKELVDLQDARERGIISEEEFYFAKKSILESAPEIDFSFDED